MTVRVLQVNKHFGPAYQGAHQSGYQNVGGVEKVVTSFAVGLAARPGFDVRVLACQGRRAPASSMTYQGVYATLAASYGTYLSLPISPQFLRHWKSACEWADIVHVHEPFPLGTLAGMVTSAGKPVVVSWHADIVRQAAPIRQLVHVAQRRLCASAARILPTSMRIARNSVVLKEYLEKCTALPIGIPLETFLAPPDPAVTRRLREQYGRFGLFVGRLVYYKGLDVLLDALHAAPGVRMVIAGEGPLKDELRARISRLGLTERVFVTGTYIPDDELASWYGASDFLAFPSTAVTEGFGIVQIEAMSCGRPVINTDLPTGVPEVSLHGQTGITVGVRDVSGLATALSTLWNDATYREKLGSQARERAIAEFSEQHMIDRLVHVYSELPGTR